MSAKKCLLFVLTRCRIGLTKGKDRRLLEFRQAEFVRAKKEAGILKQSKINTLEFTL